MWDYEPVSIAEAVRISASIYQTDTLSAKIEGVAVTISADFDGILSAAVVSSVRLSADIYQTDFLSASIKESVRLSADIYQTSTLSASIKESVRLSADIYQTSTLSARLPGFAIPDYDYITIAYSGSDIYTVVYCAAGVIQNTLTMTYSGAGNLYTVEKT